MNSKRRFGEALTDDQLAQIVDTGGAGVPCWHVASIAAELLARRCRRMTEFHHIVDDLAEVPMTCDEELQLLKVVLALVGKSKRQRDAVTDAQMPHIEAAPEKI